ncbi:CheR family methyltransferase [candidate division KSB1 bacterium]
MKMEEHVIRSFTISDKEFQLISKLVYELFGIVLTDKKKTLVIGRLQSELKKKGFTSFREYYDHILDDKSGQSLLTLIDKISTNHTFFFREADHFDFFEKEALPNILSILRSRNEKELRIWCAGCSSGEEPYTLKMLLNEYFGQKNNGWNVKLLSTDISMTALEKAIAGVYKKENIQNIPKPLLNKYFTKQNDESWAVKDVLKNNMFFNRLNLMQKNFPFNKKFHIIFCRNVMIYFDSETRNDLVDRFARFMIPDGFLFIGHSETIGRNNSNFQYIKPALYRKKSV